MAGYAKMWTTIESDDWFLCLNCAARGLFMQLIVAAKSGDETGQVFGRSYLQLAQRFGLDDSTLAKNLRQFAKDGVITLSKKGVKPVRIKLVNYQHWQGVRSPFEAINKPKKQRKVSEKSGENQRPQSSSEQNSSEQSSKNSMSGKPDDVPYQTIIDDLNSYQDSHYKYKTESIRKLIRARWAEGYRVEDFEYVHAVKFSNWQGEKIDGLPALRYFRPSTLYNASKFPGYREEKFNHEYIANQFGGRELQNLKHIASWLKKKGAENEGSRTDSIWPRSEKPVARISERD